MQLIFAFDDRPALLAEIQRRLVARFGRPGPFLRLDPISQLVMGLLGGRTRGEISMAAFEALLARFGRWEAVRDAPVAEIEMVIATVTFAEKKAPRLKEALQTITAKRDRLTLDFLDALKVDEALTWLERLPGVGRKAAAATLNFTDLRKRALVIDTHHLRVLCRLRLVGHPCSVKRAYERLMPLLPESWTAADVDEHHQLMKTLGQTICRHAAPDCRYCPLRDLCPTGRLSPSADGAASARTTNSSRPLPQSGFFSQRDSTPMIPSRNSSTLITKIKRWVMTPAPRPATNSARSLWRRRRRSGRTPSSCRGGNGTLLAIFTRHWSHNVIG